MIRFLLPYNLYEGQQVFLGSHHDGATAYVNYRIEYTIVDGYCCRLFLWNDILGSHKKQAYMNKHTLWSMRKVK